MSPWMHSTPSWATPAINCPNANTFVCVCVCCIYVQKLINET